MRELGIVIAAGLLSWGLTGLVLTAARSAEHVALPTERGLHARPTPVGGGLGLIGAVILIWLLLAWPLAAGATSIVLAVVALAVLSWIDDRAPLPPVVRFGAQMLIVAMALWGLPHSVRIVPSLPLSVERAAIGFGLLWMLNLTNFMDGIDGLAGIEGVSVPAGYALVTFLAGNADPIVANLPELALTTAAASAGYLYWNWAPARIFLGDVGSIPLGFLFGIMMFDLACHGRWMAALILPLYFVADATSTLLDRLRRGEKPWQAHREHAYQRAVLAGMTHADVSMHVAVLNVALVSLAVLSVSMPWEAAVASAVLTVSLIVWFRTRRPSRERAGVVRS